MTDETEALPEIIARWQRRCDDLDERQRVWGLAEIKFTPYEIAELRALCDATAIAFASDRAIDVRRLFGLPDLPDTARRPQR